jgi:hypothetical protein
MIFLSLQQIAKSNKENDFIKIDMANLVSNSAVIEQNLFVQIADSLNFDFRFEYTLDNDGKIPTISCNSEKFNTSMLEVFTDKVVAETFVMDYCFYYHYKCRENIKKLTGLQCIFNKIMEEEIKAGNVIEIQEPLIKLEDLENNEYLQLSANAKLAVYVTFDNYYIKSSFSPRIVGKRVYPKVQSAESSKNFKPILLIVKKSNIEVHLSKDLYKDNGLSTFSSLNNNQQYISNIKEQFELDNLKKEEEFSKETNNECSICLDTIKLKDEVKLHSNSEVGHYFHLDCIREYFKTKTTQQCPLCREVIMGDVHTEYEEFAKHRDSYLKELENNLKNLENVAKSVEYYKNYQGDVNFNPEFNGIEDFNIPKYFHDKDLQSIFVDLLKKKFEEHKQIPNYFDISLITQNPSLFIDEITVLLDSLQACSFNTEFDFRTDNDCSKESISKKLVELVNLMKYKFVNHQYFVNTYQSILEEAINSTPIQNHLFSLNQDQFNELKKVWQLEEIRRMDYEWIISSILDKFIFKIKG